MITYDIAKSISRKTSSVLELKYGNRFGILDNQTEEAEWGWTFYIGKIDVEEERSEVAATTPICRVIVDRTTGFPLLSFCLGNSIFDIELLSRYRKRILDGETHLQPAEARDAISGKIETLE